MEQAIIEILHQLKSGQLTELPREIYILIAILTLFEGPLTTLAGAAAASTGLLNPALVFLFASVGNLTGDIFWHSLGRLGELHWFTRYGRRLGITDDRLEWFKRNIRDYTPKMIFLAKVSNSFIVPALISTGLVHLSWRRWFPALLSGEILWTGSLIVIGYFAAQSILEIANGLKFLPVVAILLLILFALMMTARRAIR
jgi:membrane protein DedA with SNARE-associated domain